MLDKHIQRCLFRKTIIDHHIFFVSFLDIIDGNLKSIMRIILALAAHFKPSASQRAASGSGRSLGRGNTSHNPLSTVALAQGAAAALVSARLDASLPTRFARINRYANVTDCKIILNCKGNLWKCLPVP